MNRADRIANAVSAFVLLASIALGYAIVHGAPVQPKLLGARILVFIEPLYLGPAWYLTMRRGHRAAATGIVRGGILVTLVSGLEWVLYVFMMSMLPDLPYG